MRNKMIYIIATLGILAGFAFTLPDLKVAYKDLAYGDLPKVTQVFKDETKINSEQSAKASLVYLGPDHDGKHRFKITSEGRNGYREKGNTFRIGTILKDEDGQPLYAHVQFVGVNAKMLSKNDKRNSHSFDLLVSEEIARKVASIDVFADNKGNSKGFQKAVFDAVGDGLLKGVKDGIAELVKKGMVSAA